MNTVRLRLDKGGESMTKIEREDLHFQTDLTGEIELCMRSDRAHTFVDLAFCVNISIIEKGVAISYASTVGSVTCDLTTDALSDREAIQMEKVARAIAREELTGRSAADLGRELLLFLFRTDSDIHRVLAARFPDWAQLNT